MSINDKIKELYKTEKLTNEEVYDKISSSTIADLDGVGLVYIGHNPYGGFLLALDNDIIPYSNNLQIKIRDVALTDRPPIIISSDSSSVIMIARRRLSTLLEDNLVEVDN